MSRVFWCTGHPRLMNNIVKAEGCYVFDDSGQRFVDLESGVWAASLGHNHPAVVKALKKQADKIIHKGFYYICPVVEEAAKEVVEITGVSNGQCVFHTSGSEAVEFAVKCVRAVNNKKRLLTLSDSYHGAYGTVGTRDSVNWFSFDWAPCTSCDKDKLCDLDCPCLQAVPFDDICAMVFEPGSCGGRVAFPPHKLINALASEVKARGGWLVVNEITTGMGRTGQWFGFQHYEYPVDIVAIGKGLGAGYPVSAVAMSGELAEKLISAEFRYSQSHQNDPLGAAVALEVIKTIKNESLLENVRQMSSLLIRGLKQLVEKYSLVKEVRGRGLLCAIEFDQATDDSLGMIINQKLLDRGFIIGKRIDLNLFRLDPPLNISRTVIEDFVDNLQIILQETASAR